jgi:arginine:ornithine antiporter/lysine permease
MNPCGWAPRPPAPGRTIEGMCTMADNGSAATSAAAPKKMGFFPLMFTVITLIVGGGVFSLCSDMVAAGADGQSVIDAWLISGIGVFCLMFTFFTLSRVKPELKGGIYAYATEGFGQFSGFTSAWGYWISAAFCIISYCPLLFSALGYFFPVFGDGTNLASVIGASVVVWFYVFVVSRGVTEAAIVNVVVTLAKLIPIFTAILAIIFLQAFDPSVFMANMHAATVDPTTGAVLSDSDKVLAALTTTIWVFIGIEGAVAISGRAESDHDVGRATIVAFVCVLIIYLLISLLGLGVMPIEDLAALDNPPLAGLMEVAVGSWGATLINFGVVLSLVGSMLGYTVLTSEVPFEAAQTGAGFPKAFAKSNEKGAPITTLIVSGVIVEVFLFVMMVSSNTYQFFYTISTGLILLPYLFSAAYLIKVAFSESSGFAGKVRGHVGLYRALSIVALVYALLLFYATGTTGLAITSFLYAPGVLVYLYSKHERGEKDLFSTPVDKLMLIVTLIMLVLAIYWMATGQVAI